MNPPSHPTTIDLSTPTGCAAAVAGWTAYRAALREWVRLEEANVDRWLTDASRQEQALAAGLDDATIGLARETVFLSPPTRPKDGDPWSRERVPVPPNDIQAKQVRKVMAQLAGQAPAHASHDIRCCYYGTKAYDCWACQDIMQEYGTVPGHGSVTMAVGLKRAFRGDGPIPPENIDAALRVLRAILDGKAPVDLLVSR